MLYSWFTDALMQKNGIVKVWWEEEDFSMREEYRELNEIELEAIISDDEIEVIEHTENEVGGETIHDLVVARSHSKGKVRVENVPPDEFLIARESKDIQEARFVCHRVKKTLSDLREMYGDVDPEELGSGGDDFAAYSPER